jgi:Zn-dependent protease
MDFGMAAVQLLAGAFVVFCCLPVHEFAHALAAVKLGDPTPRLTGRLTLNPFAHLNLWGTLMIFLIGYGYATPVSVNPRNMRCGSRQGLAITAAAGPLSNIVLALLLLLLSNAALLLSGSTGEYLWLFFYSAAYINISLAVFNLLPIPPLDGFNILQMFLPQKALYFVEKYRRQINIAFIVIILIGGLSFIISPLSALVYKGLAWLAALPFGLAG